MIVATITSVTGKAWIRDAEGDLRVAREGDTLQAGEVIITSEGASVRMQLPDGRDPVTIGESTQVALNAQLGQGDLTSDLVLESGSVAEVIELLESGDGDLLDALEEPAAGSDGAGPASEGHSFVRLLRIVEDVDPLSFDFDLGSRDGIEVGEGNGFGQDGPDQPVSLTGLEPPAPDTPDIPETPDNPGNPHNPADDDYAAAFTGAEQLVRESGLPDGSSPDSALVTQSGSFGFSSPDGLGALTVGNSGPLDIGRLQSLSSNPLTVETPFGTLILTGFTGDENGGTVTYTYVLSENIDGDNVPGGTDEGVLDSISVTVTDVDGSTATGSLDIAIIDDVPAAIDDTARTDEDTPVTVDVIGNDIEGADGAEVTAASPRDPSQGSVVLNEDGTVTFTPAPGFEGNALIDYTITDADGDTSDATLTVTVAPDSTPEIVVPPVDPNDPDARDGVYTVSESGLSGGSDSGSGSERATGTFDIDTGDDGVGSLVVNGVDVTDGGVVTTDKGTLTVTVDDNGDYHWEYELTTPSDEHSSPGTNDDNVRDTFRVEVTDSDGDSARSKLTLEIQDDVPTAIDDASETDEETPVTVDVIGNDIEGADGAEVTTVSLRDPSQGEVVLNDDGTVTFTPAPGFEGDALIDYTITDADGDTSDATLTVTVAEDSTPEIVVPPEEPGVPDGPDPGDPDDPNDDINPSAGDALYSVDEAGLSGGSDAAADSETTSGVFNIDTRGDSLQSLTVNGNDVTNAGSAGITITTDLGTLTVTETDGVYSWSYTLDGSTDEHVAGGGTAADHVRDIFNLEVTDSDGDTATAKLGIDIQDDVPTAVDDTTTTGEDEAVSYNVLTNSDGTSDTQGADGATLTAASLADDSLGTLTFEADGTVIFTPTAGVEGDVLIDYTITDADGDTSTATLTVTVAEDSTPEIVVPPEEPGVPDGPDPGDPDDPNDDIDPSAGDALYSVEEAGLADGSRAGDGSATTSGVFNIDTFGDELQQLTVNGTNVTALLSADSAPDSIEIAGEYGTLTVTENGGVYSWSYTLDGSTDEHVDGGGTAADHVRDIFNLEVTDSDGDTATAKLGIDIQDDVPTAVDDTTTTGEDKAVSYNVLTNSDGTSDTQGADGAILTHAALQNADDGDLTFNADGTVTFTPAPGFEDDALINYTITDADGDTSDATLTVTVDAD
ncbi:retention module-containing protein, partial [Halomonas huangheensis]